MKAKLEESMDLLYDIIGQERKLMGMMEDYLTSITNLIWTSRSTSLYVHNWWTHDEQISFDLTCRLETDKVTFNILSAVRGEEDVYNLSEEEFLKEFKTRVKLRAFK